MSQISIIYYVLLILATFLTFLSFYLAARIPSSTPPDKIIFSTTIANSSTAPNQAQLVLSAPETEFNLTNPSPGDVIQLELYFRCPHLCPPLWLEFPEATQSGVPLMLLVHHPIFYTLPLNHLETADSSLYQKNPRFQSISDFLKVLPESGVFTEPFLAQTRLPTSTSFQNLLQHPLPTKPDFIYTTYKKPRLINGWLEFSRFLTTKPLLEREKIKVKVRTTSLDEKIELTLPTLRQTPTL